MSFPIISPSFINELVDLKKTVSELPPYAEVKLSVAAMEYVLHITDPAVVKKLMSVEEPISYKMAYVPDGQDEELRANSENLLKMYPTGQFYWQLRELIMGVLQNKDVNFEKRMLLLNYALKNVQGMIDQGRPDLIPQFASDFVNGTVDYEEVLKYFESIYPVPPVSLSDGISLLKSLKKATPGYKEVLNTIYRNLGVSGPETLELIDMKKYLEMRKNYSVDFMEKHSNWVENIMINFVWAYSVPYAGMPKLNIWDNYVFFNSLYNALKIFITCYMPGKSDEDFANAVAELGRALMETDSDFISKIVIASKNTGQANNGDMAILTVS